MATSFFEAGGAGSIGASIWQGEQQRKAAKENLNRQEQAQKDAAAATAAAQRKAAMEAKKAAAKKPDVTGLLAQAQAIKGPSATMLTKATGIRPTLAQNATLGGGA